MDNRRQDLNCLVITAPPLMFPLLPPWSALLVSACCIATIPIKLAILADVHGMVWHDLKWKILMDMSEGRKMTDGGWRNSKYII